MNEDPLHPPLQLVKQQRTLVLAIADPAPWSAPVYYLYARRKFYFFSNPESRHIRAAISLGRCAASVSRESDNWQDIEGLQMEGTVQHVTTDPQSSAIFTTYVAKFPCVHHFLKESACDLPRFCEVFHSQLYAFMPTLVLYLNNREAFASRLDITANFLRS